VGWVGILNSLLNLEPLQGQLGHIDEGFKKENKMMNKCFLKINLDFKKRRES
jgi:hypothetical protein